MGKYDDKTEAPTPKKKRQARKEGQVAKSQEIGTWGTVLLASFVMPQALGNAGSGVRDVFLRTGHAMARPDEAAALALLGAGLRTAVFAVLPLALTMLVAGAAVNLAQTKGAIAPKRLKPKASHLNPMKGLKRLFSAESGWNTVKVTARTALLAAAASVPLRAAVARLGSAEQPPLVVLATRIGGDALAMVRLVALAGLVLGAADFAVTKRRTTKQLRMTKQEVKDEHKNAEGDPRVKSHMRAKQREMSRNRMLAGVADASVVIVNPTHVAVALKYGGAGAPRLVAKGKGEVARRIREAAETHGVPMVRDVPLARALHDTCPVDHPIPEELYAAVAKVLAFVMTVGKQAATLGGVLSLKPG